MNSIVMTILSLSASGSLLALVLFAGKTFLKNRIPKAFSYYIWLLVLLRLVLPISAPVNLMGSLFVAGQTDVNRIPSVQDDRSPQSETGGADGNAAVKSPATAVPQQPQNLEAAGAKTPVNTRQTPDLWSFIKSSLIWIWLAGSAVSFGWFVTAYLYFVRRIRRSRTAPHGDDLTVFEELIGSSRLSIVCSGGVATPMLVGIFRPVIVLPPLAYVRSGLGGELKDILRHELTHYKRKDVLYKWLAVAVTSLHWFNPLMPFIRKEISAACELSCDEAVIGEISEAERQRYGNTLLAFSAGGRLPAGILTTTLCEEKKQLKERLVGILHYRKITPRAAALALALALLLTGCAGALGVVVTKSAGDTDPQSGLSAEDTAKADGYTLIAAVPLADTEPYEAPEVETAAVDPSDIASVIVSYPCENETEVFFCRAQSGGIFCAYKTADGRVTRFYEAGLYEEGYDIGPFENVFSHDGFYIQSPVGAAYTAIDYYYFEADGTLKLLVRCDNFVIENDMDGDGKKELLWFYHGYPGDVSGARDAFYCYERNGQIYVTAFDDLLMSTFPDIAFPGHYFSSSDDPSVLRFTYHLNGEESDTHEFRLRFTEDSLTVYSKADGNGGAAQSDLRAMNPQDLYTDGKIFEGAPEDFINSFQDTVAALTVPDARKGERATDIRAKNEGWQNSSLFFLNSIPERNIYLYGYNDTAHPDYGLILDIGEEQHIYAFPYLYMTNTTLPPEVSASEDGSEIFVACHTGSGTGVSISDLHVFQVSGSQAVPYHLDIGSMVDSLNDKITMSYDAESKTVTVRADGVQIAADSLVSIGTPDGTDIMPDGFYFGNQIWYTLSGNSVKVSFVPTLYSQAQPGVQCYLEHMPPFEADVGFTYDGNGAVTGFDMGEITSSVS